MAMARNATKDSEKGCRHLTSSHEAPIKAADCVTPLAWI